MKTTERPLGFAAFAPPQLHGLALAILTVLLLSIRPTIADATADASTVDTHFEITQIHTTNDGLRLVGPLQLTYATWRLLSRDAQVLHEPNCDSVWLTDWVRLTNQRQIWLDLSNVRVCVSKEQLVTRLPQLWVGRLRLKAAEGKLSSRTLSLDKVKLSCGTTMPIKLHAQRVYWSKSQVKLQRISLWVSKVPLGWFPSLTLNGRGQAGLLPPRVIVGKDTSFLGLPIYVPITQSDDLTITPGLYLQNNRHGSAFGELTYGWHDETENPSAINLYARSRFVGLQGHGIKTMGTTTTVRIHGSTTFGTSPELNRLKFALSEQAGFRQGRLALGWALQPSTLGIEGIRTHEIGAVDPEFSEFRTLGKHHLEFGFGHLELHHTGFLSIEPHPLWLTENGLSLSLAHNWSAIRVESHSMAHLQNGGTLRSEHENNNATPTTLVAAPLLQERIQVSSRFGRFYGRTLHEIGAYAHVQSRYRQRHHLTSLNRFLSATPYIHDASAALETGLKRDQFRLRFRGEQLVFKTDDRARTTFWLNRFMTTTDRTELSLAFARDRVLILNARAHPTMNLSIGTSYTEQTDAYQRLDYLGDHDYDLKPTVSHDLGLQFGQSHLLASVWYSNDYQGLTAGRLRMRNALRCDCINVVTELRYLRYTDDLSMFVQVHIDLEGDGLGVASRERLDTKLNNDFSN